MGDYPRKKVQSTETDPEMTQKIKLADKDGYHKYTPQVQEGRKSVNILWRKIEDTQRAQMEFLEMKNAISEMIYTPEGVNSILDTADEKIGELEIIALGNIQIKHT